MTSGPKFRASLLFDWIQVTIFPFTDVSHSNSVEEILQYSMEKSCFKSIKRINDVYDLFWYLFRINRTQVLFDVEKAVLSYEHCYSYKNIKLLLSDSHPEFGIHILMSGTACREFEYLGLDYADFFYKLREYNPHYTRIDVSFDDFTGKYFTLDRIVNCINNVEVVTKFRSALQIKKENLISLDNIGHTIQFGSRASDIQFTFYDKLKERQCNNYELISEYADLKFWNRFETRFRNEKALSVINNYLYFSDYKNVITFDSAVMCESFNDYIKSIINNYISFRVFSHTDKRRSRWPYQKWWSDFLKDCRKIRFQNKPLEFSIVKKKAWLDRTVSFCNFCVLIADLKDFSHDKVTSKYLYDLFMTGADKLTSKELQYINEYRLSKSLNPFTLEEIREYVDSIKEFMLVASKKDS